MGASPSPTTFGSVAAQLSNSWVLRTFLSGVGVVVFLMPKIKKSFASFGAEPLRGVVGRLLAQALLRESMNRDRFGSDLYFEFASRLTDDLAGLGRIAYEEQRLPFF